MTTTTKPKTAGDVFIQQGQIGYVKESHRLQHQSAVDGGTTTANISQVAGYPVIDKAGQLQFALSGDEASVVGLIEQGPEVLDLAIEGITPTSGLYSVVVRGPVVVNETALPANDAQGAAFVWATIKTALEALNPPFVFKTEPTKQTTQTT